MGVFVPFFFRNPGLAFNLQRKFNPKLMKLSRFNPFLIGTVVSCLLITSCSKSPSADDSGNDGNSSEIRNY